MEVMNESPHKIYIKSNTVTVMRFLFFLSGLLFVLVAGLCVFVVFGCDDTNNYHWHEDGQFYYTVDDYVATIVKYADNNATEFVIPESVNYGGKNYPVTTIGKNAFTNHRTLTAVTIPNSVTKIMGDAEKQKGAFSGCTALTTVNLGQGVSHIEAFAFKNCLVLQMVKFPASAQFVQDGAFQGCLALESIELNSNGILGKDCFAHCDKVTTLKLADDVRLTDSTRQVLAGLTQLNNFVLTEENPTYCVQDGCLLTKDADTVILGGCNTSVPNGVTRIADWAWGERAASKLFVPATVTSVGVHSFQNDLIFTDASTKPAEWSTTVPVYTEAKLVTFTAAGNETKSAYIYRDTNGTWVYPKYDELFADVQSVTPFLQWDVLSNTSCTALYQSTDLADSNSIDALQSALSSAEAYLTDADVRLRLTIDYWEKFKTIYYTAAALNSEHDVYQFVVDRATQSLQQATQQITAALNGVDDQKILESTTWYVALQNLVDAINRLDVTDLSSAVDKNLVDEIGAMVKSAEFLVANHECIDDETGNLLWRELREKFEHLEVNVAADGRLGQLITACGSLRRENYTTSSWQNLQDCLVVARQVTNHNLSISVVRENLEKARVALREITLAEHLIRLDTWLSVCEDLTSEDYQVDEYDRLWLDAVLIKANRADLTTNCKVDEAVNSLKTGYQNLVATNRTTFNDSGTGILNKNSLPYFIVAVILFTGAVTAGAAGAALKHQVRQYQE